MMEDRAEKRLLATQDKGLFQDKQVVEREAQLRLRKSGYRQLHLISCEFHGSVLTLRGRVSTFHMKQVAQTLIRGMKGVAEINNQLEVVAPPRPR
jgi:osmotically-inducible protein OsmY